MYKIINMYIVHCQILTRKYILMWKRKEKISGLHISKIYEISSHVNFFLGVFARTKSSVFPFLILLETPFIFPPPLPPHYSMARQFSFSCLSVSYFFPIITPYLVLILPLLVVTPFPISYLSPFFLLPPASLFPHASRPHVSLFPPFSPFCLLFPLFPPFSSNS